MKNTFLALLLLSYSASSGQTILPPTINCVTTDLYSGDVYINWTAPSLDPCGPFVGYVVFGATNVNGPYLPIDTITNQAQVSFLHIGANATILDWHYFMMTLQNCPGSVSVPSDTIKEEILTIPELDNVTVTPVGVQVNWIPNPSPQTAGYYVYYALDNGFALRIDTIFGRTSNTYIDIGTNPDSSSIAYTIAAFDGCYNLTVFNDSSHKTIFLSAYAQSSQIVTLNWTPYINWPGIASYNVETSIDGGNFTIAQLLPDGTFGYIYSPAGITGDSICFRISPVRQTDSVISSSNQVCFFLSTLSSEEKSETLTSFRIYPNPFTTSTTIEYTLSKSSVVSLKVYNVLGRVVMENPSINQTNGKYSVLFENEDSGNGMFVVELDVAGMKMRKSLINIE